MFLDHHAYLLIGERETLRRRVGEWLKNCQPADVHWMTAEVLGIETSRALGQLAGRRAWNGRRQFFVLAPQTITLPAQQALLKTLEEPAAGTCFIIICQTVGELLPTVRSRCQLIRLPIAAEARDQRPAPGARDWARQFLTSSPPERLALLKREIDQENKISRADELTRAVEELCYDRLVAAPTLALAETLTFIRQARDYLSDPASSAKLIFEHLAVVL